jgi:hypothetical protein
MKYTVYYILYSCKSTDYLCFSTIRNEKNYFYYGSLYRPGKGDGEIIFSKGVEGDRNDAPSGKGNGADFIG